MRSRLLAFASRNAYRVAAFVAVGSLIVTETGSLWPLEAVGALPLIALGAALALNLYGLTDMAVASYRRRWLQIFKVSAAFMRIQGVMAICIGLVVVVATVGHGLGLVRSLPLFV